MHRQRFAEALMLILVQMYAVHPAGRCYGSSIEKLASTLPGERLNYRAHPRRPVFATLKLWRYSTPGRLQGGGASTRIGGTDMPGSMGAPRTALMSAPRPWAECQALCPYAD